MSHPRIISTQKHPAVKLFAKVGPNNRWRRADGLVEVVLPDDKRTYRIDDLRSGQRITYTGVGHRPRAFRTWLGAIEFAAAI